MMLAKGVFCSSAGVFSEVVRGELGGLADEGSVLLGVGVSWTEVEGDAGLKGWGWGGIVGKEWGYSGRGERGGRRTDE